MWCVPWPSPQMDQDWRGQRGVWWWSVMLARDLWSRPWPGTQTRTFFFSSSFSQSVSLSVSVDLCPDFSRLQGLLCGVEPRWKANCQRQWRHDHQDLGLAIWRLPVDADRALAFVSFFDQYVKKLTTQSCFFLFDQYARELTSQSSFCLSVCETGHLKMWLFFEK